ncbi:Glycerophosphodiester phosphodiesterase domain-containing protein 1, partial [Tetrabaena socialis]
AVWSYAFYTGMLLYLLLVHPLLWPDPIGTAFRAKPRGPTAAQAAAQADAAEVDDAAGGVRVGVAAAEGREAAAADQVQDMGAGPRAADVEAGIGAADASGSGTSADSGCQPRGRREARWGWPHRARSKAGGGSQGGAGGGSVSPVSDRALAASDAGADAGGSGGSEPAPPQAEEGAPCRCYCCAQGLPLIENTLCAFRHSVAVGADLLELDVQMTQDGHVVVFHDSTLHRMCGQAGRLSACDLGSGWPGAEGPAQGEAQAGDGAVADGDGPEAGAGSGRRLCRLCRTIPPSPQPQQQPGQQRSQRVSELRLSELPRLRPQPADGMYRKVDIKQDDPALVAAVAALAARHPGRTSRLLWGSFRQRTAARCLAAAPHVPLFASMQRALVLM